MNRNPRLEFLLEVKPEAGGAPIMVRFKKVVTAMEAPRLQPGMIRTVRYLPKDPETLAFTD